MSSVQSEFDDQVRRLVEALAILSSALKADPNAPPTATLDDLSAQLSASLDSHGRPDRDLVLRLKHQLELFAREGVLAPSLSAARELIYIFQELRFSGLRVSSS